MYDHNKKGEGKGMVWMMIPCLLLLVLGILSLNRGPLSSGGFLWSILIGIFVIAHIWMMFRGHGKHDDSDTREKAGDASKVGSTDEYKHNGSCH